MVNAALVPRLLYGLKVKKEVITEEMNKQENACKNTQTANRVVL